jgi:hypothetical protein
MIYILLSDSILYSNYLHYIVYIVYIVYKELRRLNKNKKDCTTEINKCQENNEAVSGYDEQIKFVDKQIQNLKETFDEFKEDDNYIKKEIINILNDKEVLEEMFKRIHEWY